MAQSTSANASTQPESLRLFFGISCPASPAIVQQLHALDDLGKNSRSGLRVVREANLHVTVKFLGDCPPTRLAPLAQVLDAVCTDTKTFTLKLQGAGSFHGALWLGVEAPELLALAQRLQVALLPLGFTADSKIFRPHLTVARLGHKPQFDTRAWQQQLRDMQWGELGVTAINLYQSTTLPTGAQYQVLHSAALITR